LSQIKNDRQEIFATVSNIDESYNSIFSQLFSSATSKIDCYLGHLPKLEPAYAKTLMEFLTGHDKKNKGLQIRIITRITKDNLQSLKELMRYSDVFHTEGIDVSFYIIDDKAYLCDIRERKRRNGEISSRLVYSTHPQFVKLQQLLFENLVAKSIPAREKIKEIEKGNQREFIETIHDPSSTLDLAKELIRSSEFEVLVLFSTINSFYRAECDDILDLLGEASKRGVNVRVLVKIEDEVMKDAAKQKIKRKHERINVNFIEKSVRSKISVLVADQRLSLAIEVSDDSKDAFSQATGLATYSNSESTVFTYYSMFENIWIQAELERQSKVKQAYFQMFKGQRLKDEIYTRNWSLAVDEEE